MKCRLKKNVITLYNKYLAGTKGRIVDKYVVEATKDTVVVVQCDAGVFITNIDNVAVLDCE